MRRFFQPKYVLRSMFAAILMASLTFGEFSCDVVSDQKGLRSQLKLADILALGGALQFFQHRKHKRGFRKFLQFARDHYVSFQKRYLVQLLFKVCKAKKFF